MIVSEIGAALKAAVAELSFTPEIKIAWPDRDFFPDGSRFLAVDFIRAPNDRLTLGAHHRFYGRLAISAVVPAGKGTGEAEGLADAICRAFPCDGRITLSGGSVLRITATGSVRDGYRDGGYWRVPVTIPYEVLADPA